MTRDWVESELDALMCNEGVDGYRATKKLGEGGMGAVYLAERRLDEETAAEVVIKFLLEDFLTDPASIARFEREARAATNIGHPNIIRGYEVVLGSMTGYKYYVMEPVNGQTLAARIEAGALTLQSALHIASQLASALSAAHVAGIVHRDLKPRNVLLVERGDDDNFVKLFDFGIAKRTIGDDGVKKTSTGEVLGTQGYMAPEQAGSSTVDHRADIYALGVVLYEMLAGKNPFGHLLARQVVGQFDPLTNVAPSTPHRLARLVERMLAFEPDNRPATMAMVERELAAIAVAVPRVAERVRRHPIAARPPTGARPTEVVASPPRHRRHWWQPFKK